MGDSTKSLTEVKLHNFHCSSLTHQASHLIVEGYQVRNVHKCVLTALDHLLVLHMSENGSQN